MILLAPPDPPLWPPEPTVAFPIPSWPDYRSYCLFSHKLSLLNKPFLGKQIARHSILDGQPQELYMKSEVKR